jgi:Streptomycin adenylyltransferase
MKAAESAGNFINRLVQWVDSQPLVRAMVLTSSRANDRAPVDLLSDYDVILAVSEMRPFAHDESWLQDFGKVLVLFRDQGQVDGLRTLARLVLYKDNHTTRAQMNKQECWGEDSRLIFLEEIGRTNHDERRRDEQVCCPR